MDRAKASVIRISRYHPFFSVLLMGMKLVSSNRVKTAETNGYEIFFNPTWFNSLTQSEADGVLVHEIIHTAYEHCTRIGVKDPYTWNVAADIVTNNMLLESSTKQCPLSLPGIQKIQKQYVGMSVEEVYSTICEFYGEDPGKVFIQTTVGSDIVASPKASTTNWQKNIESARSMAAAIGSLPPFLKTKKSDENNFIRALWRFIEPEIGFDGPDRRLLSSGIYSDASIESVVRVKIALDMSASTHKYQADFMSAIGSLERFYGDRLWFWLYFFDTSISGPYKSRDYKAVYNTGVWGGGTDFSVVFDKFSSRKTPEGVIFLTDGKGNFPKEKPPYPVLWVVTPDGIDSDLFPFGEVVRMVE